MRKNQMKIMRQVQQSSQTDYVVQSILKSGLLLDEDLDYILMHYKSIENYPNKRLLTRQKVLSGISLGSTAVLIQQVSPIGYVLAAAVPLLIIASWHISEVFYRRRQRRDIETLLKVMTDICSNNREIIKYFKQKQSSNTATVLNMFTSNLKTFIEIFFKEETLVLKQYKLFVEKVSSYIPLLFTDYFQILNHIDLEEFSDTEIADINGCVSYVSKLCDIYLLIASNTLTCLAVTVSSNFLNEYHISVDDILEMVVPLKSQSLAFYKDINEKFNDIKYYYLNKDTFKMIYKAPKVDSSQKLYMGTCTILSRCSDIVEKSHIVFKKLEEHPLRTVDEKQLLHGGISELSNQVCEYYEYLQILQKLYEVDISKTLPAATSTRNVSTAAPAKSSQEGEKVVDASLNPTEPGADEEYELFMSEIDDADFEYRDCNYYEEENRKYAAVLSRELKQKLKEDLRFRAARQKRGIIDEEPENLRTDSSESKLVPEYDPLPGIVQPLPVQHNPSESSIPLPPPPPMDTVNYNLPTKPVPPPPPPPMSPVDIEIQPPPPGTDFLQSIKIMSTRRQLIEDVFECSEEEEIN